MVKGGEEFVGRIFDNSTVFADFLQDNSTRDLNQTIHLTPYRPKERLVEDIFTHGFLDVFMILEGIVLLTLLFAIMNDTYDRVKMNAKAELTRSRAAIVNDCEATFCKHLTNRIE